MPLRHHEHTTQTIQLTYYTTGEEPRLLIASGIHGDEYESIELVRQAIEKHHTYMPPLLFIPAVSPSAVAKQTRHNSECVDVNRYFYCNSPIREVCAVQALLSNHRFDHCISFHEDPAQEHFYLYDSGEFCNLQNFVKFKSELQNIGIPLLNGIDDPNDPLLGHLVTDGYVSIAPGKFLKNSGPFEIWLINKIISQRVIAPEIPGKLPLALKQEIIDLFFRHIVLELS